jgi:drug/metabolite transporter (DMT)-like permease
MSPRILVATAAAMLAFAANSVLCRLALGQEVIDPASFATVRVVSGALTLSVIVLPRWRSRGRPAADRRSVASLFVYMMFFSFAYTSLSTGTGALILFGAVQLTMFVAGLRGGEEFRPLSWGGLVLAVAGLVYLVSPGLTAPDPIGAALMAIAGIAWGLYSLLGRGAADPIEVTANNFIWSVPLVLLTSAVFATQISLSVGGLLLAVASGALASGLGYVIWYMALRGLTATRAATIQLSVPVIAAIGGIALLSEVVTLRLVVASIATLGGVALVLAQRVRVPPRREMVS